MDCCVYKFQKGLKMRFGMMRFGMGSKNNAVRVFLILLAFAVFFSSSVSAAENLTYTYKHQLSGQVLAEGTNDGSSSVSVPLPNVTWIFSLVNNNSRFAIRFDGVDYKDEPVLDINATEVDLNSQHYAGEIGHDSNYRYYVYYGYALNISQLAAAPYDVVINYSDYTIPHPVLFKCNYSFDTHKMNVSACHKLSASVDASQKTAVASATGFSAFLIADDTCVGTCGGKCPPCSSSTSSGGGGGGGGGGGAHSPSLIYVTPTPEGSTVQVFNGDELVVIFNDKEYHFRVIKSSSLKVTLRSLSNYLTYDINFGEDTPIGLESFLSDDITVSMHMSNQWSMLTFTTIEHHPFTFPLLPPKPRTKTPAQSQPPAVSSQVTAPSVEQGSAYVPPAAVATARPAGSASEVAASESPVDLWAFLLGFVFVMILIGGFVLYRMKFRMDKPPTAGPAGQPSALSDSLAAQPAQPAQSDLSPQYAQPTNAASSSVVLPAQSGASQKSGLVKEFVKKAEDELEKVENKVDEAVAPLIRPEVKRVSYHVPKAKLLELQKFIYHAYSLGFTKEQVRQKLLEKDWPEDLVDDVLEHTGIGK